MEDLHNKLAEKSDWYRGWHEHKAINHKLIHWLIFGAVVVLVSVALLTQMSNWRNSASDSGVTVSLPKPEAELVLDPQTKTVSVGETFDVNIVLDTAFKPIDGVDLYALHFDPSILNVVDSVTTQTGVQIKPGTIMSVNAINRVDQAAGSIVFSQVAEGGTNFTGKGTLATITFRAVGAGSSFLKFDFNRGSTVDTNAAHKGKDQLDRVVDAIYSVQPK
jgi:hypothetical protein